MKLIKPIHVILFICLYASLLMGLVIFEKDSENGSIQTFWDALWYSIVTLTTVGYGDSFPVTLWGKVIGLIFIFASLGLMGYFLGVITDKITTYMENKSKGEYGTNFSDHFVIIGWDHFAKLVADQVTNAGKKIAVICENLEEIDKIYDQYDKEIVFVLYSDLSNYDRFYKSNIDNASAVFINFEDDSQTLIHLINVKKLYPNPKYVVSLRNAELKDTFVSTGVTFSISVNEAASKLVASYIFEPDVAVFTEDLMGSAVNEDDNDIIQYYMGNESPLVNQSYLDTFIKLKKEFNAVILGLSREIKGEYTLIKNPKEDLTIKEGDYIILLANGKSIPGIEDFVGISEGRLAKHQ